MNARTERIEHYRRKSEEIRTVAEAMRAQEPRDLLLSVAMDYLMLAQTLERTHIPDPIPASE